MRGKLVWMLMMLWSAGAMAQSAAPALVVRAPNAKGAKDPRKALTITKVEVESQVVGFLAETKMTLTFHNPFRRQLAGQLYFPLPAGATVSGYALDVNGKMVDGVVVEKEKARVVFEKEVRKGVDPGLVEWVRGNKFKTRVYPIPARGSRTISVSYVSDLSADTQGWSLPIPLTFPGKIKDFSLRLSVVGAQAAPSVSGPGTGKMRFKKEGEHYRAQAQVRNQKITGMLKLRIPATPAPQVLLEKNPDGEIHFCIIDFPPPPPSKASIGKSAFSRLAIVWDASGSRADVDHQRELDILRRFFAQHRDRPLTVDLILVRNTAGAPQRFVVNKGDASALLKSLAGVVYDGGTQLGTFTALPKELQPEFMLLFSDGISNFGRAWPKKLTVPVFALGMEPAANHLFLQRLAQATGGAYFNLSRMKDEAIVAGIGHAPFSFLSAKVTGTVSDLSPAIAQPVSGRFTLSGKLIGKQAQLKLRYGSGGEIQSQSEFQLDSAKAVSGNLLARFWAQQKVMELAAFPRRNQKQLVELGRRYSLVTPGTSLMVLERLDQYVAHQIAPPRTLPEMRNQYLKIMDAKMAEKKQQEQGKLKSILALWKKRVAWWQTKFRYPKNFRFLAEVEKKMAAAPARVQSREVAEEPMAEMDESAAEDRPSAMRRAPKKVKKKNGGSDGPQPAIALKAWDPQTPYMTAVKQAPKARQYPVYLEQKQTFGQSPAFYLDCAEFFLRGEQKDLGLRILSNVAEMELENPALLRILAHRLAQLQMYNLAEGLFEEILRQRPEEPQSYRDLALVLAQRLKLRRAMKLLAHVVMNRWDRFSEIEVIALMELNRLIPKARAAGIRDLPIDRRLVKALTVDVRIVLGWDADLTDIDLWVIEPSGEKAYFSHPNTTIGGLVSRDFTQGYGPETYNLHHAMRGSYQVQVNFYGSSAQTLAGAVTLQLTLFTNFGRPNEKRESITLRLTETKDTITVGVLEF